MRLFIHEKHKDHDDIMRHVISKTHPENSAIQLDISADTRLSVKLIWRGNRLLADIRYGSSLENIYNIF